MRGEGDDTSIGEVETLHQSHGHFRPKMDARIGRAKRLGLGAQFARRFFEARQVPQTVEVGLATAIEARSAYAACAAIAAEIWIAKTDERGFRQPRLCDTAQRDERGGGRQNGYGLAADEPAGGFVVERFRNVAWRRGDEQGRR